MTKRLLIDASHAEETRVVVLDGNRLEDFDVETQSRRQLKGNIYLAKVVRVEPSLQAAFVEYGGNRHGFLAFGEIHPDYYQIPVADRQRLIALQEEEARAEEEAEEARGYEPHLPATRTAYAPALEHETPPEVAGEPGEPRDWETGAIQGDAPENGIAESYSPAWYPPETDATDDRGPPPDFGADTAPEATEPVPEREGEHDGGFEPAPSAGVAAEGAEPTTDAPRAEAAQADGVETALSFGNDAAESNGAEEGAAPDGTRVQRLPVEAGPPPETIGGDQEANEDVRPVRPPSRFLRSYKIQEVIRRRQILLIQVVKEERGSKGAALTTYISLAGRYCVLMPNSPRGGGISRKITSTADRRRLKEVTAELEIPRGMGLIVRTAGAARPKAEIKRDGEYLLRLWDDIREQTMRSIAPSLIYEEASLIKRAIRDVYSRDIDELMVDGEEGWRAARDYMRMLMPAHAKKVQLWPSGGPPLFAHAQVEQMLDSMLNPVVQLRSGGYLVINQTEALVAIDVNSGRSTRERGIEETALRTNLEAAEEAARQLRLRDLAGLIVIDFIDMESKKHNAMVERRMADALKTDRARIQIGHISHFGLLELSRQRLRPSLAETSLNLCPVCGGSGHVRSTESAALHVLREIEEEGAKRRAAEILVYVAGATALYILNNKRQRLTEIEARYGMRVAFAADETLLAAQTRIERIRAATPQELPPLPAPIPAPVIDLAEPDLLDEEDDASMADTSDAAADADAPPGETAEESERRRKRRRRRRRGGRREDGASADPAQPDLEGSEQPDVPPTAFPVLAAAVITPVPVPGRDEAEEAAEIDAVVAAEVGPAEAEPAEADSAKLKRGRRGGRRRKGEKEAEAPAEVPEMPAPPPIPAYVGPTPADPFAMSGMDIFEALAQAEEAAAAAAPPPESGPVIKPVIIGSGEAEGGERKKGWWRR